VLAQNVLLLFGGERHEITPYPSVRDKTGAFSKKGRRGRRELQHTSWSPGSLSHGQPADRIVRACSVSSPIVATRSSTWANFSWPRMRATKSTATCWPYRSALVSRTNASTVRVRPENVGLVPTETAAWYRSPGTTVPVIGPCP